MRTTMLRLALTVAFVVTIGAAIGIAGMPATGAAPGDVTIGISATIDARGAVTVLVSAPGCAVTPPGASTEIVVQTLNPTTGAVGEGAVALGSFTAPGQGSAVIPAGTPVSTFLLTVDCNGGALHGSQSFTILPTDNLPPTAVAGTPAFTG